MKNSNKKGFTLAEILITLAIIGVIATLTIPALTHDIQDQQFKVAWKNDYQILDQAMRRLASDNGGKISNLCQYDYNNACLRDLYLNYLSYIKKCDNASAEGCFAQNYKYLNKTPLVEAFDIAGAVLNNGSTLKFNLDSDSCTANDSTFIVNYCGEIKIDVNGLKGPNVMGKDLFAVYVFPDKIAPHGCKGMNGCNDWWQPSFSCMDGDTSANNNGYSCAAKYLMQ